LLESTDKRKLLGNNAYQRIATQFSIDNMVNKYLTIFTQVI
jgi:hypothetical protein